jgi:hypothetical protein
VVADDGGRMAPSGWLVNGLASLVVLVPVGRASLRLLRDPGETHEQLVSARERRVTTVVGVPLALLLAGVILFVSPDFTPGA